MQFGTKTALIVPAIFALYLYSETSESESSDPGTRLSPRGSSGFMGSRVYGSFRIIMGLGFGVWGLGFGVWGLGFRVWGG